MSVVVLLPPGAYRDWRVMLPWELLLLTLLPIPVRGLFGGAGGIFASYLALAALALLVTVELHTFTSLEVTFSHPAEPTHPDVDEALADVRDAALDRGVPVGGARLRNRFVAEKVDAGYRMANPGNTTSAIGATVEGWIDETRG